jgi:hypothetical protein
MAISRVVALETASILELEQEMPDVHLELWM